MLLISCNRPSTKADTSANTNQYSFNHELPKIKTFPNKRPEIPAILKIRRIYGSVVVRLNISEQGEVTKSEAITGPEELHPWAIKWVRQFTFKPATLNGNPVPGFYEVTVIFNPS